ncbi:MAG: hypothetical protein ACI8PZ_007395, partial [Myxococcota bacterium]
PVERVHGVCGTHRNSYRPRRPLLTEGRPRWHQDVFRDVTSRVEPAVASTGAARPVHEGRGGYTESRPESRAGPICAGILRYTRAGSQTSRLDLNLRAKTKRPAKTKAPAQRTDVCVTGQRLCASADRHRWRRPAQTVRQFAPLALYAAIRMSAVLGRMISDGGRSPATSMPRTLEPLMNMAFSPLWLDIRSTRPMPS